MIVPKFSSFASSYDARSSFNFSAYGSLYRFIYDESDYEATLPLNYSFQDDALTEVIDQTAKGLNLSFASENYESLIDVTLGITQGVLNNLFGLWQNALIVTGKVLDEFDLTDGQRYGWRYHFTGSDPAYPGHETYGTAYGFRFRGWGFETIDIVLDSDGHLYGSSAIGNFTPSSDTDDVVQWSIHQHDGDDIWYIPNYSVSSFSDLKEPYFIGKELNFFYYFNNVEHHVQISDFTETFICVRSFDIQQNVAYDFAGFAIVPKDPNQTVDLYIDGNLQTLSSANYQIYSNLHGNYQGRGYFLNLYNWLPNLTSINLPGYYGLGVTVSNRINYYTDYIRNGLLDSKVVAGNGDIWLDAISLTPAPNVPEIPVDTPIPFPDIPEDPTDYDPDPDSDPDPVPGVTYPDPDVPDPEPAPPVPSIVSGNDDLWPDMNEIFNTEAEMDSFLTPLSNFEFTSLANLTDEFSASIVWVSTIMMSLYNGSEYSVLFSILAIFFIACALLGIYKWWSS